MAITDPHKAVAVDVAALKANPLLPGGFLVTGLVYDVTTGRVEILVPPLCCVPKAMRDDQSDGSECREYGQGGTSFYLFGHCIFFC
jgi:hypothetical protein